jgi:hypothetical protein
MKNLYKIEDELYVVSDNEGISKNCWIINSGRLVQVSYLLSNEVVNGFKVILTTNDLLIKDGVQAIDDKFLEWFVKNPSCEEVEIDKAEHGMYKDDVYYKLSNKIFYKIIIPREEQTKCYCGHTTTCDCGPKETKQETVEEVAENFWLNDDSMTDNDRISYVNGFGQGAKWQQEQIGKSEFLQRLRGTLSDAEARRLIFEQFKKK